MESVGLLRSVNCLTSPLKLGLEKPGFIPVSNAALCSSGSGNFPTLRLASTGKLFSSSNKLGGMVVSCVQTTEATPIAKLDGDSNGAVMPDSSKKESDEKVSLPRATFPDGIEALVHVFDETDIAELKFKIGDFEMHIKGKVEAPVVAYPAFALPIPTTPMDESASSAALYSPPNSSEEKARPYTHIDTKRSAKLAALEASGATGYLLAPSPTVGFFRTGRTLKGKKQPPVVKEGVVIKEGQTIGFVDQLGAELPVKSDVAGEVLKVLYDDGESVGYGDPLIAVRP